MTEKNKWLAREEELQKKYPTMDKEEIEKIVQQEWYESLCPEDKAMIDKEAKRRVASAYVFTGVLGVAFTWALLCAIKQFTSVSYIVTDKEDQKVVCIEQKNPANKHIIEFGAFPRDSVLYRHIRIGDKLSVQGGLKSPVESLTHASGHSNIVMDVNGKNWREAKRAEYHNARTARRDSMLRTMHQNQK